MGFLGNILNEIVLVDIILITFSLYHLIAGLSALGPKSWIRRFSSTIYSLKIENNPSLAVALKAISLFALCTSAVFAVVFFKASNEIKVYFVIIAAALTLMRALLRFICQKDLIDGFGLDSSKNQKHCLINTIIGSVYLLTAYSALFSI